MVLQGYAAAADIIIQDAVRQRHLELMRSVARLTGADALQLRTFFATGLIQTISAALDLPEQHVDRAWSAWVLELAAPPRGEK
ncbi:hypothetical protein [Nocardia neocaledoniensis]|uniref:hypothetical protein n=1 Tax=Nocardia neocaledoniensis TaxID=236511 RepID=UPI00245658BC|nr:hypothetical protein [Nocardia neocaledoniensis]